MLEKREKEAENGLGPMAQLQVAYELSLTKVKTGRPQRRKNLDPRQGVKDGIRFKDKIPIEDGDRNGWNAIVNAQNLFKGQKEMIKKKYFRREREIRSGSKRSHSAPAIAPPHKTHKGNLDGQRKLLGLRIPRDGQVVGLTDSWPIAKKMKIWHFKFAEHTRKRSIQQVIRSHHHMQLMVEWGCLMATVQGILVRRRMPNTAAMNRMQRMGNTEGGERTPAAMKQEANEWYLKWLVETKTIAKGTTIRIDDECYE